MRYLDYFLLFGGLVSMIYLYSLNVMQREKLKEKFLDLENREAILKESFYDESAKQNNLRDILKVEYGLNKRIKELHVDGLWSLISEVEEQLKYIRELRFEIDVDAYAHQLSVISAEERSLDNWDSF